MSYITSNCNYQHEKFFLLVSYSYSTPEVSDLHAPRRICLITPQEASDILWGTTIINNGDNDLRDMGMLSPHEESDFEYGIEEITAQPSTTSDESDDNIADEKPWLSSSCDFSGIHHTLLGQVMDNVSPQCLVLIGQISG